MKRILTILAILLVFLPTATWAQKSMPHISSEHIDTLHTVVIVDSGNATVTGWTKGDSAWFRAYGNLPALGGSSARTVPAYLGGTTQFLRGDSSWQIPPGGAPIDTTSLSNRINADSTDVAKRAWVNALRAVDSLRAIVREGSKVSYADSINGVFEPRAQITTALAGKQASGTYLVPNDSTNQRTYSASLYQVKGTYLVPGDSTTQRTYSNSLYLKNADSTSERTYSNSLYLKNADSTSERTYSNSLYLKNADSTTQRTYSNALYESKAQLGTDTASVRTYSNALYESKTQMGTDTSSVRAYSTALYESKTQMGTDSTSIRSYSNSLYESKTQLGTDTTNNRTYSDAKYAPKSSPTFTGTVTIPTPFTIGAVSMTATGTALNYVAGVTSAIQTQFTGKVGTGTTVNGHALSSNVTVTASDVSLGSVTNAAQVLKSEIAPFFAIGLDSAIINVTDKYPMGELPFAVTVDTVVFIMSGGVASPSVTPLIHYGTDISATGTSLATFSAVTSKTTATNVANTTAIPAGAMIWLNFSTASSASLPNKFMALISGHRP